MKRNAILLMGIFSAHLASAQLFSDNFDNYALGSYTVSYTHLTLPTTPYV